MKPTISVLDHGLVRLDDYMGSDLAIVNAAQASFDRESEEYGEKERGILRFLMSEEHGVPFESAVFKFKLRMPIFLARQFVKHRVASWSEHSGRYSELEPLFYTPEPEHVRSQVGKPGAYAFEPVDTYVAQAYRDTLRDHNLADWVFYRECLDNGIAKELARLHLPVNIYTNVVWTINARSLFNVIRLRVDSHAQYEAQTYGHAIEQLAKDVIPDTMRLFIESERPKP